MRYVIVALFAVLATACLDSLNIVDAEVMALLQEGAVASVDCPDSLSAGLTESGQCLARNSRGTILTAADVGVAKWGSSNPLAVEVDVTGLVTAVSAPDTVWIIARGTFNSRDSTQIFTY